MKFSDGGWAVVPPDLTPQRLIKISEPSGTITMRHDEKEHLTATFDSRDGTLTTHLDVEHLSVSDTHTMALIPEEYPDGQLLKDIALLMDILEQRVINIIEDVQQKIGLV